MRRAFALFEAADGTVARADGWRVLQTLGEEDHSPEDFERLITPPTAARTGAVGRIRWVARAIIIAAVGRSMRGVRLQRRGSVVADLFGWRRRRRWRDACQGHNRTTAPRSVSVCISQCDQEKKK